MMMSALGIVAALLIGAGCRLLDIPSPAPPKLQGALLVVAMTLGYLLGERWFG
jgi:XapX domain-containing protein